MKVIKLDKANIDVKFRSNDVCYAELNLKEGYKLQFKHKQNCLVIDLIGSDQTSISTIAVDPKQSLAEEICKVILEISEAFSKIGRAELDDEEFEVIVKFIKHQMELHRYQ